MNVEDLHADVEMNRRHAKRRLTAHATGLRHLADVLDRHAAYLDKVGQPGYARHVTIVGDAVHEVMTYLGNAHFETAIGYAAEADQSLAEHAALTRTEASERDAIDKIQRDLFGRQKAEPGDVT